MRQLEGTHTPLIFAYFLNLSFAWQTHTHRERERGPQRSLSIFYDIIKYALSQSQQKYEDREGNPFEVLS